MKVIGSGTYGTCIWEIVEDHDLCVEEIEALGWLEQWSTNPRRLIIRPANGKKGELEDINFVTPWEDEAWKITSIVVEPGVKAGRLLVEAFAFLDSLLYADLSSLDTSETEFFRGLFIECFRLKRIDLARNDMSSAKDFDYMFYGCSGLESVSFPAFNLNRIESMVYIFEECDQLLHLDLSFNPVEE